jgi:hypothetical protein
VRSKSRPINDANFSPQVANLFLALSGYRARHLPGQLLRAGKINVKQLDRAETKIPAAATQEKDLSNSTIDCTTINRAADQRGLDTSFSVICFIYTLFNE